MHCCLGEPQSSVNIDKIASLLTALWGNPLRIEWKAQRMFSEINIVHRFLVQIIEQKRKEQQIIQRWQSSFVIRKLQEMITTQQDVVWDPFLCTILSKSRAAIDSTEIPLTCFMHLAFLIFGWKNVSSFIAARKNALWNREIPDATKFPNIFGKRGTWKVFFRWSLFTWLWNVAHFDSVIWAWIAWVILKKGTGLREFYDFTSDVTSLSWLEI